MKEYRSNCIIEGWREYLRLRREWVAAGRPQGGEPYIWLRSSRLAPDWAPHVGVGQYVNGQWVMSSFGPIDKSTLLWWQLWRIVIFVGYWIEGD